MEIWAKVLHSICNMGTRGLPDMHTLSPRACGPVPQDAHIRQTTRAHVTNTYCILRGWIKGPNSSITAIMCQVGSYRTMVGSNTIVE